MRILRRHTWDRNDADTNAPRPHPAPPAPTPPATTGRKSRKRRLLERITRFASAPSLHRTSSPCGKRESLSCVTLESTSERREEEEEKVKKEEETTTTAAAAYSESTLDFFVECQETLGADAEEEVEKTQTAVWDRLPNELKLLTLSFLEPRELVRASVVCKEWHRKCFDGQLWQTLDASEFYNRIPVGQLAQLICKTGPFVKRLNLRGCSQLTSDWRIETVANVCRNLYSVNLEGCKFERNHVHFFILRNPTLVDLNLAALWSVTNSTLKLIANSLPHLERLNISFCTNSDGTGLRKIITNCRKLHHLEAHQLHLSDLGFWQTLHETNQLTSLLLSHCTGIQDYHIQMLTEGPHPTYNAFTDRTSAPARTLRHLDLTKSTHLTDAALHHLTSTTPHLTTLILSTIPSITDDGLSHLLPTLPKLQHLDLEDCPRLTNTTLRTLAHAAKSLISLSISNCETIDDSGVIPLFRHCPLIRNIEMDNTLISDLTLIEATHFASERAGGVVPHSRERAMRLVVYDCPNVTWMGVREVMRRNAEARVLVRLKCCWEFQRVVDEHLEAVVAGEGGRAKRMLEVWGEGMRRGEEGGRRWRRTGGRQGRSGSCVVM
ncbi:RNI-like protein [Ascodesmis nigricans]|uniref:RNI-like protein n=1 Tax=Ascodesmis nigricans TaxID=341454 RepID=A0A4S2MPJ5_9PEZI|nr:RNI-like protein [Ascodesmis nigricans]